MKIILININRIFTILIISAISMGVIIVPVQANTRASTRYVASNDGVDSGDCSSSASPCKTIQYAVNQASSEDTILVAQGTYEYNQDFDPCPFLVDDDIGKDGRAVVCIVDKSLNILGGYTQSNWQTANPTSNLTFIDGENNRRGVFFIGFNSTTASLVMEGFTIQNSQVRGPDSETDPSGLGGGMMVAGARVTLRDMVFRNNKVFGKDTSSGYGGAAAGSGLNINWSRENTSNLLERVVFEDNQSSGGDGPTRGGLAFGALFVNASVTINDSSFTNNVATAGNSVGSGWHDEIAANAQGGAIGGGGGTWVLNNISATGNQAIGGHGESFAGGGFGGAIHVELADSFMIANSQISHNLAKGGDAKDGGFGAGGGILVNTTPSEFKNVKIYANTAQGGNALNENDKAGAAGGGGLYLWKPYSNLSINATSKISNSNVTDNLAKMGTGEDKSDGGGGGGIQIQGLHANINHTTIAKNRLGPSLVSGQGLLVLSAEDQGSANINYSIIAEHVDGGSGAVAVLVQENDIATFNQGLFAGNSIDTNVKGSPLPSGTIDGLDTMEDADYPGFISSGSPHFNYHLRLDSAAKDRTSDSSLPDDIDSQNRPYNIYSDFGSDEYWPFPLSANAGEGNIYLDWTAGSKVLEGGVSRYEVVVTCLDGANPPDQGECGEPIDAELKTSFELTGLSTGDNNQQYTIHINALDSLETIIAISIIASPNNQLIFLPLITK
jgi:hypothetical protein